MLMTLATVIGKTVWSMALALLTGPMIRAWMTMGLESAVSKYERKAAKSPSKDDDAYAASFRKALEEAKKAWEA